MRHFVLSSKPYCLKSAFGPVVLKTLVQDGLLSIQVSIVEDSRDVNAIQA